MFVPSTLLRRLYVRKSLKNVDLDGDGAYEAFQFKLKNVLASGTISGKFMLKVDGREVPPEDVEVEFKGEVRKLSEFTPETKLRFSVGDEITFTVKREGGLALGKHKIEIEARTQEYGRIRFAFEDEVS